MPLGAARFGLLGGVLAGGSLQLIEKQTVSGVTQVDFTSIKETEYDVHFAQLISIETTSSGHPDASKMQLRFSNDGGSTFESGASDYAWANQYSKTSGGIAESKDSSDSSIEFTPRCNSGEPTSAYMYLYGLGNSNTYSSTNSQTTINMDQKEHFFGAGIYTTAETIDAVRFYNAYAMTGTIKLFGVEKS